MIPSSPFAVGEIVWFIGENPEGRARVECEVVSELYWGQIVYASNGAMFEGWIHDIDGPFGEPAVGARWCARPEHLRKIPGKGDLTVLRWADCVFDPNRLIIKV